MSKINYWTSEEEATLQQYVTNNPDNLQHAFKLASKELGRTQGACSCRWYSVVQYLDEQMNTNGTKVKFVNRKNIPRQKTEIKSQFESILDVVYNKLSKDQQTQFLMNKLANL